MNLESNIAEYLRKESENIAKDLCIPFGMDLPFNVNNQRVEVELFDKVNEKGYKLSVCLEELFK